MEVKLFFLPGLHLVPSHDPVSGVLCVCSMVRLKKTWFSNWFVLNSWEFGQGRLSTGAAKAVDVVEAVKTVVRMSVDVDERDFALIFYRVLCRSDQIWLAWQQTEAVQTSPPSSFALYCAKISLEQDLWIQYPPVEVCKTEHSRKRLENRRHKTSVRLRQVYRVEKNFSDSKKKWNNFTPWNGFKPNFQNYYIVLLSSRICN